MSESSLSLGYEFSFRLALERRVGPDGLEALRQRIRDVAIAVFHDRFPGVEMDFDVELGEGTFWGTIRQKAKKVAPWIVGVAVTLGQYKDAREGAVQLAQDIQWVVQNTRQQVLKVLNDEYRTIVQMETDERTGVLARIAVATAEYKAGQTTAEVCVAKIKRELDAIAQSEHRVELTKALTSYLHTAYGDGFFAQLRQGLGPALPPSQPDRTPFPSKPGPSPTATGSRKKDEDTP